MAQDGSTPVVDLAVQRHVVEVLRRLLHPGELDEYELYWELNDAGRWQLVCEVVACGERYFGSIIERDAGYPVEDGLDIFTDGFEDFVAESRFAWGQQRELRDRPWRAQR